MLSRSYIEKILDYVISHGADYGEVFFEDASRTRLKLADEQVVSCACGRESGIGIRLFYGFESEYFYSADADERIIFDLLKRKLSGRGGLRGRFPGQAVLTGQSNGIQGFSEGRKALSDVHPLGITVPCVGAGNLELGKKIELLKRGIACGKATSDRIVQGSACYTDEDQRVQIANTEGVYAEDRRQRTRVRLNMTAQDPQNESRQTGYEGPGAMSGPGFLEGELVAERAAAAARAAVSMLGARICPVGRMPVIIANGFGGLFFHEACGHSLEGSAVAEGCSEFAGKVGEKIAADKVTLVDDGTVAGEWGSLGIDDEGVLTQKNVLIKNGRLKGYLLDRMNARKMGLLPTGSGRRENYRFAPTSRMTNTYIAPGEDKLEKMIGSVDKGLYVKEINAGSVDPATGEFNFNTGETYLIERGEITVPVKSATLIGTGREILPRVDMVSDNFALEQGYCYAGSGQIPIGAGQPAVRITEMTVGGKDI